LKLLAETGHKKQEKETWRYRRRKYPEHEEGIEGHTGNSNRPHWFYAAIVTTQSFLTRFARSADIIKMNR
jgi:hypothetical protein